MARWVCYVAAITMTFAASLLYLSWAYEEPGFGLGEVELQPLSEHDWMRFLLRRSVPLPALNSSLEPWRRRPESLFLQTSHPALLQYPPLPYDDAIACLPRKFGYTQEQADALFSPSRRYPPCGDPLAATTRLEGNRLMLHCASLQLAGYVVGPGRDQELLGDVEFQGDWQRFSEPVDIGDAEFAFSRCSKSKREALIINRFNETAARRARDRTEALRRELNVIAEHRPLAVYLIILDSVSRQHFFRNFPQTIDFLNEELSEGKYADSFLLYDFVINNAHGENTQPNMVAWLFGYNFKYHRRRVQGLSVHRPEDEEQYLRLQDEALWKVFEQHGFVTLFGFDTVWDFLSHSTGRRILTDHVISNFYHACKKLFGYMDFSERQRCIGLHNAHYYSLEYLRQFDRNYKDLNRFAYIHLSPGHEKSGTVIRTADRDLMLFLESLLDAQQSEGDFLVVVAADHGKHSSEWDKVHEGFLENQLPLHLMIASKSLIERLGPAAHSTLQHNSKRLVSRLDWHLSFRHLATLPYGQLRLDSPLYEAWKQRSDSNNSLSVFLEEIPDSRDCSDADIPIYYCSCLDFVELPVAEALRTQAILDLVDLAVRFLNSVISQEEATEICHLLTLDEILKVDVQVLKVNEKCNRNFKVRISILESQSAKFEAIGFMASAKEFRKQGLEASPTQPIINTTFVSETGLELPMMLQLKEVVRVDSYEGICEELARAAGATPSTCVCKVPFPEGKLSATTVLAVEKLIAKAEVVISKRGQSCHQACVDRSRGCSTWGLTLFNDERVLRQAWKTSAFYPILNLTDGQTLHFRDLRPAQVVREGSILRLVWRGEWHVELADWKKGPNCDSHTFYAYGLCACF